MKYGAQGDECFARTVSFVNDDDLASEINAQSFSRCLVEK